MKTKSNGRIQENNNGVRFCMTMPVLNVIETVSMEELRSVSGGSFKKTMDKVGKFINKSDPYAIYSH